MKYINLFDTQAAYDAAEKYYPNTSYIEATDEVVYQEIDPLYGTIVAKYTTYSNSSNVKLTANQELFSKITVEGVDQTIGTGAMNYTFATAGEHEVIYKLTNPTTAPTNAFWYCSSLTSATINNPVETIAWGIFGYAGLTSVTIPNSVTSIAGQSFVGNNHLTSITCLATTPPRIETSTFQGVPADCAIYVPAESVNAYKTANYWSAMAAYIQAIQ